VNINTLHSRISSGGKAAEDLLFKKLSESFRLFLKQKIMQKQDLEEVVQETMLTIVEKYKDIEFKTSFSAWAYRVMEIKLLNYYKTKYTNKNRTAAIQDDRDISPAIDVDPILKKTLLDCLRKINDTNNRHARVLNLHFQGFIVREICEKLKLTRNGVYILLSRARTMLKNCLERGDVFQNE